MKFNYFKTLLVFLTFILLIHTTDSLEGCLVLKDINGNIISGYDCSAPFTSPTSIWGVPTPAPIRTIGHLSYQMSEDPCLDWTHNAAHLFNYPCISQHIYPHYGVSCYAPFTGTHFCCGDDAIPNNGFEINNPIHIGSISGTVAWPQDAPLGIWKQVSTTNQAKWVSCPGGRPGNCFMHEVTDFCVNDCAWTHQNMNLTFNNPTAANYTFSAWAYVGDSLHASAADIIFFFDTLAPFSLNLPSYNLPVDEWHLMKRTVEIPPHSTLLQIRYDNNVVGKVYYDDITIVGPGLDNGILSDNKQYICRYNWDVNDAWELKDAKLSGQGFKIMDIGNTYDVISNEDEWFSCDPYGMWNLNNDFSYSMLLSDPAAAGVSSTILPGIITLPSAPSTSGTLPPGYETIPAEDFFTDITGAGPYVAPTLTILDTTGVASITISPSIIAELFTPTLQITGTDFEGYSIDENNIKIGTYNTAHISESGLPSFTLDVSPAAMSANMYTIVIKTNNTDGSENSTYTFVDALEVTDVDLPTPYTFNEYRFVCYDRANYGAIAECCGYSLAGCNNQESYDADQNPIKTARAGQELNIIQDFYGSSQNTNYVARIGIEKLHVENIVLTEAAFSIPSNFLTSPITELDKVIAIRDWSGYDNLEFDVVFTSSNVLKIRLYDVYENELLDYDAHGIEWEANVRDYSVTGDELGMWHHIIIPLDVLPSWVNKESIWLIYFDVDFAELRADLTSQNYATYEPFTGMFGAYSVVYGFDKFVLTKNDDLKRFCTNQQTWASDLDEAPVACEEGVTTSWTSTSFAPLEPGDDGYGTMFCCGDDQGRLDVYGQKKTETFNGDFAGCFAGVTIPNNTLTHNPEVCTLVDWSLSGNDGVNSGGAASWTQHGHVGGAYEFTATFPESIDTGIDLYDVYTATDEFSVAAWSYDTQGAGSATGIANQFQYTGSNGNGFVMMRGLYDHSMHCSVWNGGPFPSTASGPSSPNVWEHWVCSLDAGGIVRLYKNGVEVGNQTGASMNDATGSFLIGAIHLAKTNNWIGKIDQVQIYNRTLSPTEVQQIYGGNSIPASGLLGNWGFDGCGLLFYDSTFRSCILSNELIVQLNSNFPTPTGNVIQYNKSDICINQGSWYCDFDSTWKDTWIYVTDPVDTLKNISDLTGIPDFPTPKYSEISCCPNSFCFNGSVNGCEPSYTDPQKPPINKSFGDSGYRCNSSGSWAWNTMKYDWNHEEAGYCMGDTDCFPGGTSPCLESGDWTVVAGEEHYCENGFWTTRTKYIAAQLMNYTLENNEPDFTLFCDDWTNTLNKYDKAYANLGGLKEEAFLVGNVFGGPSAGCPNNRCVNNFCVLNIADEQVIVGVSLNRPIDELPLNFLQVLNKSSDYCNNLTPTRFEACSGDHEIYYLEDKQILLFSTADFAIDLTGFESFAYAIMHPITSIINFVRSIFTAGGVLGVPGDYITNIADFDRLYIAVKGNKSVYAAIEEKFDPSIPGLSTFLTINYTGFTQDLCDAVIPITIACNTTANQTYMFSDNPSDISLWPDLTAKLRIK